MRKKHSYVSIAKQFLHFVNVFMYNNHGNHIECHVGDRPHNPAYLSALYPIRQAISSPPVGCHPVCWAANEYRQVSNIRRTKTQHLKYSRTVLQLSLPNPLKPEVENEDVVGAGPTGDAPTTSEWSTILLPTMVHLILEVLQWVVCCNDCCDDDSLLTEEDIHQGANRLLMMYAGLPSTHWGLGDGGVNFKVLYPKTYYTLSSSNG